MPKFDSENEAVAVKSRAKLKRPPMYKVILHNDDFTTMDFVIYVLQNVFQKDLTEAFRLMLQVHTEGASVAGIYTHEIAEMKAEKVVDLAQSNGHPLMCTVEEE